MNIKHRPARHVTQINSTYEFYHAHFNGIYESCHAYLWHPWVPWRFESLKSCQEWAVSRRMNMVHRSVRHVTHINETYESCHAYEQYLWVMSHYGDSPWMRHVTQLCHACHVSQHMNVTRGRILYVCVSIFVTTCIHTHTSAYLYVNISPAYMYVEWYDHTNIHLWYTLVKINTCNCVCVCVCMCVCVWVCLCVCVCVCDVCVCVCVCV